MEEASAPFRPRRDMVSELGISLALINAIPALVAYIDCNMVLQYYNPLFERWFSLAYDSTGKSLQMLAGKQVFDQLQRQLGRVLSGYTAYFQISDHSSNGSRYLEATLSPDFDLRGKVKGFVFHGTDTTEKNRTERLLRDYVENASIGLHWVNSEGIITWANPAELKMLGYTEAEYVGHHISEFHRDKDAIRDVLDRLTNKQTLDNYEADLVCKDGSIRQVSINSSVLWEGDKFIHTRCFTIDLTGQKLADKAMMASDERFKTMASLVPLVIWSADETGACNFLSDRWQELTGKPISDGLGNGWTSLVHPEDKTNIMSSWARSVAQSKPFEAKFRLLNGRAVYSVCYAHLRPQFNAANQLSGFIGILQDISSEELVKYSLEQIVLARTEDLRRKNADLNNAEKALQEKNLELENINNQLSSFAYIASHDLQEPLRKIQLFSNRFLEVDGDKVSEKGKQLQQAIYAASERMRKFIQDLLAYSRSINTQGDFEPVDLNMLLNEVMNDLEVKIEEKRAFLENRGLPRVNVIRFQFHQLLANLLNNALKFSKHDVVPHIVLRSEIVHGADAPGALAIPGRHYHHIVISDNGIGFDPESSDKIFEPFRRLHAPTQFEGTGIGLAICKKFAENHQGFIKAEGRINEGATFHIYLPIAP